MPNENETFDATAAAAAAAAAEAEKAAKQERLLAHAERMIKSMQTPQAIRDLQTFDGNPVKLHSFIRSVDNLLPFIEGLKDTPFHDVWLQALRNKIVGEADNVLEIYGTRLCWDDIKANLIAYYNDKRDAVTLTRELFSLQQITSVEDFYGRVQHVLSLLINHANIDIVDARVKADRVKTYTENALQVFLAGLKEPIGGNVRARTPATLKIAFDICIEEQNCLRRSGLSRDVPPRPTKAFQPQFSYALPRIPFSPSYMALPQPRQQNYFQSIPTFSNRNLFPKPVQKPTPMEVDRSIRSKQINYMNRPQQNRFPPRPFGNQQPPQRPFYQQPPQRPFNQQQPRPFYNSQMLPNQPFRSQQPQTPRFMVEELTNLETNPFYYTEYPDNPEYFCENVQEDCQPEAIISEESLQSEDTPDELNFPPEAEDAAQT